MTDLFQFTCAELFGELVPPVDVRRESTLPIFNVEFGQLGGKVHDGDGYDFRFPRQAQGCA